MKISAGENRENKEVRYVRKTILVRKHSAESAVIVKAVSALKIEPSVKAVSAESTVTAGLKEARYLRKTKAPRKRSDESAAVTAIGDEVAANAANADADAAANTDVDAIDDEAAAKAAALNAAKAKAANKARSKAINQAKCIEILRTRAIELGRPPHKSDMDESQVKRIKRALGHWPKALIKAGLKPGKKRKRKRNNESYLRWKEKYGFALWQTLKSNSE